MFVGKGGVVTKDLRLVQSDANWGEKRKPFSGVKENLL